MNGKIYIGIDIGSVSVKQAVLLENGANIRPFHALMENGHYFKTEHDSLRFQDNMEILLSKYIRHHGQPEKTVAGMLEDLFKIIPEDRVAGIWAAGSGARLRKEEMGFRYVNEFRAVARAMGQFYPKVRTIFELGGERSRYILLSRAGDGGTQILDYEMNGECAAGTGSFFDQQVERLKYRVEDVGKIVTDTDRTASIAGRCSVFAKTDMIHAQQRGYTPAEVLKGLCEAVVRNFKGSITKGKRIEDDVALIGGVAANGGVIRAFRKVFDFSDGRLCVPEPYAWMGAIGSALIGWDEARGDCAVGLRHTERKKSYPTTHPLTMERVRLLREKTRPYSFPGAQRVKALLGLDIGSVSTNLALIDGDGNLIYGIYRMTDGRPVEVVKDSMKEMCSAVGHRVEIVGTGTTGSGRELIGSLVGADVIKDEITAHKTGALHISRRYLNRDMDTIFEIGGQDSKFISIQNGVVVDFSLNEACAAGTGSFLEEQARQIGISIRDEFASLALGSSHPLKLGERCTVFMEKELVPYLQQGVPKKDIVAGLALSVVQNYLNRVVKKRKIGDLIFFQGGTAYNDSVAAAFATVLGKEIVVPPHNGIMGAIGAALLAGKHRQSQKKSTFRGWDIGKISWRMREFTCSGCSNECQIQEFDVEGEKSFWGDKCSVKYRKRAKSSKKSIIQDLVKLRERMLFQSENKPVRLAYKPRARVGIPRTLYFYDRLPFWRTYFEALGFEIVLSGPSRQDLIHAGVEAAVAEPCFPIQVAHGHLLDFAAKEVDAIFLPNVINEEDPASSVASFLCPWAQTIPLVSLHTQALKHVHDLIMAPNVQFREGRSHVEKQLLKGFSRFKINSIENRKAVRAAYMAQLQFNNKMIEAGSKALDTLVDDNVPGIVLLGRPYNLYDTGLNLNIPVKLREHYGVNVIPMDCLPLDRVDIRPVHDHMFWNYGRRILQAARFCRDYPMLYMICLSNFKCGPDSYIRHYIEEASEKSFLFLQLDSHANDAGIMTRIEAFLESKGMM